MKYRLFFLLFCFLSTVFQIGAQNRENILLKEGWSFTKDVGLEHPKWEPVNIPHDWAIYGPFDMKHDLQIVAIEQNNETEKTLKTGRTGGLPFMGKGEYRTTFEVADTTNRTITLLFDGAMSNSRVKVNGKEVIFWPNGYNAFHVNLDGIVKPGTNRLQVNLENFSEQSRWYTGAGLYRNVHLIITRKVHIPIWGTYITTPHVKADYASVNLRITIAGTAKGQQVRIKTQIKDINGKIVATAESTHCSHGQEASQNFIVDNPDLWSTDTPNLYTASTKLYLGNEEIDCYDTRFGIRSLEYIPEKGFFLNGGKTKFKGVCNHHDLGPLGAAINKSALRHRLNLLKDMGANAIRTSHNVPSPELVSLCDEMGMMLMIEPFDDWGYRPKSPNGYGHFFGEWAQKDITNMVKQFRNHPSVVMWSIGNEVPSQCAPEGLEELRMLQDLVHLLDPTRPVTCGMEKFGDVLRNGFGATIDIPSFNYKPQYYEQAYQILPQKLMIGSETASTLSSRGIYYFPVIFRGQEMVYHPENQASSYDNENTSWSNTPDLDFLKDENLDYLLGQFVWTGFDYLGEPTPYDTNAWPSHSSLFGIIDLASIPKDRYFLYRSVWNTQSPTLHILPHWNWKGKEGENIPVFVYTSYPKAELFINGKSQGIRTKNDSTEHSRYRLMWNETIYQPGEIKVTAYDSKGQATETKVLRTAGKPHHLVITPNRKDISLEDEDLIYFTIQIADKEGNIVPTENRKVKFKVEGSGHFLAVANGDPTSLHSFQAPHINLFSGAATAIAKVESKGKLLFTASAPGIKSASYVIDVK